MVEKDFYYQLKDDSELTALLGGIATDSKIYPIQLPLNTTMPAIVYKVLDDSTLQENIYEMIIQYDCVSDLYDTSKAIRDRVQELLDRGNSITTAIPMGYFLYYNSTIENYFNYKEPNLDIFHNVISFRVQYNDIYGFLLQENSFYLLQENGFNFRIV